MPNEFLVIIILKELVSSTFQVRNVALFQNIPKFGRKLDIVEFSGFLYHTHFFSIAMPTCYVTNS